MPHVARDNETKLGQTPPDLSDPAIVEIALMLVREATDPAYRNSTLIEGLSVTLASRVAQAISGHAPKPGCTARTADKRVQKVLAYIEKHLSDSGLSIDELAAVANISAHQLSRLFKAAMGRTPHQFVIAQRISLAKLMMLNGDRPLSEIARHCGFANQAHFTTRFREQTGETPNRFKERLTPA